MLKAKDISFSYPAKKVLENVSFNLNDGKAIALLGRNGSGKSTLIRILLGALKGYSGNVEINGQDINKISLKDRAKLIAYIPQYTAEAFPNKVIDTVVMAKAGELSLFSRPSKHDYMKAEEKLESLGIAKLGNRTMDRLSGGERQLVLIARALFQDAKTLLLDEPTASLDYSNQIMVMEKTKKLTEEGYSAIFSTHSPEHALMYSDSVLLLNDGRSEFIEDINILIESDKLSRLYNRELYVSLVDTGEKRRIVCLPK